MFISLKVTSSSFNVRYTNDFRPIFDPQSIATFDVSENATVLSAIHVVNATDRDTGSAGTVKYGIVDPTDTFNISQNTGEC